MHTSPSLGPYRRFFSISRKGRAQEPESGFASTFFFSIPRRVITHELVMGARDWVRALTIGLGDPMSEVGSFMVGPRVGRHLEVNDSCS